MTFAPLVPSPWGRPSASERLRVAWQQRHESDCIFRFPTALGWCVATCGVYSLYILYQLMRRSAEHNRRRLELLDAAASFSWEQAKVRGLSDELRPNFQRISEEMRGLSRLTTEFRDPALWVALAVVTFGVAEYAGWVVVDRDLAAHAEAEHAVELELAAIYSRMGWQVALPDPAPTSGRHRVASRIVATVASLGVYSLWWMRDVMVEGNAHLEQNWRFEDDLARASQSLMAA